MSNVASGGKRVAFIGGGVRSGKSAFALRLGRQLGAQRVFVATAQAFDAEMQQRIDAHVRQRGAEFRTLEAPLRLPETLEHVADAGEADVVVIDCLTLWLSNLLLRGDSVAAIDAQIGALTDTLSRRAFHAVVVSSEVGMGIVPESALGRAFRDIAGAAHQALAGVADDVYWAMLGCVLRLRPGPVALEPPGDLR